MGSIYKAYSLHSKQCCFKEKHLGNCLSCQAEKKKFFLEYHLYFKELWLLRIYLADMFLTINKVNFLFEGKQLTAFVANEKNLCFQVKVRILENLNPSA